MATMKVDVRVDRRSFAEARGTIHAMRTRANNVQSAWNVFLDWFTDGNRQQFGSQGKRWGTPWRALKKSSLASKRRAGYTGDILVRDSLLLRSVSDRPMGVERIGPHDMEAGTLVSYAAIHHRGAPRANIPARPLWNAKRIKEEGAATSAVKTWIVSGRATVNARKAR